MSSVPYSILTLQCHNLSSLIKSNPFVVNLSSHPLTPEQTSLLTKGLNFCPTPGDPDLADVRNDLDRVHQRLRQKQHFLHLKKADTPSSPPSQSDNLLSHLFDPGFDHRDFRNKSKWAPRGPPSLEAYITSNELGLQYYKHFPRGRDNLLPKERQALRQLKTISQSVIIKQADKGSAVVLQDRRDYINEGFRQLNDPNYYEPQP